MYLSWVNPMLGSLTLTPTPDLGRLTDRQDFFYFVNKKKVHKKIPTKFWPSSRRWWKTL